MAGTLVFSFDFIRFHFFFFFRPFYTFLLMLSDDVWKIDVTLRESFWLVEMDFPLLFSFPPPLSLSFTCVYVLYGAMCHSVVSQKNEKNPSVELEGLFFFYSFFFHFPFWRKQKEKNCSSLSFFFYFSLISFVTSFLPFIVILLAIT